MRISFRKPSYTQVVLGLFIVSIIISAIGSAVMAADYVTVYQTLCGLTVGITRIAKTGTGEDQRNITIYLFLFNNGSRPIYLYQYGIHLELNGKFVADQQEFFPDLWVHPGENRSLTVMFVVTSSFVNPILEAEESGHWRWMVLFSMRIWIVWLYLVPQFYIEWLECEEVP